MSRFFRPGSEPTDPRKLGKVSPQFRGIEPLSEPPGRVEPRASGAADTSGSQTSVDWRPAVGEHDPSTRDSALKNEKAAEDPSAYEKAINDENAFLERWVKTNQWNARRDTILFWCLKAPAIVVSASAGVISHYDLKVVAMCAGAVASLCVLVDALHPMGQLRNVHKKAVFELRGLQSTMHSRWRTGILDRKEPLNQLAASILKDSMNEQARITRYLQDAETSLGATQPSASNDKPRSPSR